MQSNFVKRLTKAKLKTVEEKAPSLSLDELGAFFGLTNDQWQGLLIDQPEIEIVYRKAEAEAISKVNLALLKDGKYADYLKARSEPYKINKEGEKTIGTTRQPITTEEIRLFKESFNEHY
jgi:hypothetical protein